MKKIALASLVLLLSTFPANAADLTFPKIDRHPGIAVYRGMFKPKTEIPRYDGASKEIWQVDLRSTDLSRADARASLADLLYASFDDDTIWPASALLPPGFDPKRIMELGMNPGLGIRGLHALGITGKNVGIAIIDQPLLVDHAEYASRLRLYEEINIPSGSQAPMHGPAVASIAAGKSVGVAPEADLYFIATYPGTWTGNDGFTYDFSIMAKAIRRILEINAGLPEGRRIRVISISLGWSPQQAGYKDVTAAVDEAKAAGILVTSSSLEETFGFKFQALGRAPMADPDSFASYEPGLFLASEFYLDDERIRQYYTGRLMIPMDSRTTASPTGPSKYVFYREGGWSWSIPYVAGVYALACQVDPGITPDAFWQTAMRTGQITQVRHDGKNYPLGPIIDPGAIMAALKK